MMRRWNIRYAKYALVGWICFSFFPISCKTLEPPPPLILRQSDQEEAVSMLERIDELNGQGKYAEAIPLAIEVLKIVERAKGPSHPGVAACLDVLGGLYISFGDDGAAAPVLKRALEVHETLEGRESPNVATTLGLLAKVYMELGDYVSALPLATRALSIREKTLGEEDFRVSTSLNALGEIYLNLGKPAEAESAFMRALEIRKKHGDAHGLAITLNLLGQLYYKERDYASAESLAIAALELGESALGKDHLHLADTCTILGKVKAAGGDFEEAFHYLKRTQEIHAKAIDHMKGFTSEKQKLRFLAKMEVDLHTYLSLILTRLVHSPEAVQEGLNAVLRRKGLVLEVQRQFQEALLLGDETALKTFRRLSEVRAMLSKMTLAGPEGENLQTYRVMIDSLRAQKEQLEMQLSTLSKPYTMSLRKAEANGHRVSAALPKGSELLEFANVRMFDFSAEAKIRWVGSRYFAFLLPAGNPERLRVIDLGDAARIDSAIASFKETLTAADALRDRKALQWAEQLYALVFADLNADLAHRIGDIFVSPDGHLSLLPLEVLRQPNGRFLVEEYVFNYLPCGRDLLGFGFKPLQSRKPVIMGNPDFDMNIGEGERASKSSAMGGQPGDETLLSRAWKNNRFERLPGTEREVQVISGILGRENVMLYTDQAAKKDTLMAVDSPRFLHLATHGFSLGEQEMDMFFDSGLSGGRGGRSDKPERFVDFENPLIRSGLAMAGANTVSKTWGRSLGIVTAEEILSLKLRGTEMVVLSACETGVGEVVSGEGVFGLSRAFIQAGAKSLVMSLWPVPDRETCELMSLFYDRMSSGKVSRAQALRGAILSQIQSARDRYGNPHPLYWGGFVFLGEP